MARMTWLDVHSFAGKKGTPDPDVTEGLNQGKEKKRQKVVSLPVTEPHNAVCYRTTTTPGSTPSVKVILSGQDDLIRFNNEAMKELYRRGIVE